MVWPYKSSVIFSWVILGACEGLCQDKDEGLKEAKEELLEEEVLLEPPLTAWRSQISHYGPPQTL